MAVIRGEGDDLRRERRGQRMRILGSIDAQHGFHAGKRGRLRGDARGVSPEQRNRDLGVWNGFRAGDALGGRRIERLAVVFTDDEYLVH